MNDYKLKIFLPICIAVGIVLSSFGFVVTYIGYSIQNKDIQYLGIGLGIGTLTISFIACIISSIKGYINDR